MQAEKAKNRTMSKDSIFRVRAAVPSIWPKPYNQSCVRFLGPIVIKITTTTETTISTVTRKKRKQQ